MTVAFQSSLRRGLLQVRQKQRVNAQVVEIEDGFELGGKAIPVAQLVFERGGRDLDVVEAHGGIHVDGAVGGGLADYLFARLALLGDENDDVAQHLAAAGQPAARQLLMFGEVAELAVIGRAQGRRQMR